MTLFLIVCTVVPLIGVIFGLWVNSRPLAAIRRGEYGNAALFREWRLAAEQADDNRLGVCGLAHFKRD